METDALLTAIGLVVAVYTLLPAERRLQLRLRIGVPDVFVIATAILLVHYIKFFPVFMTLGIPDLGPWRWGFDPDNASYLALAIAATFVVIRISTARLHPRKIATFRDLAERLLFSEKFPELLFLLETNLSDLRRLIESRTIPARLSNWIRPHQYVEMMGRRFDIEGRAPDTNWFIIYLPDGARRWLVNILPDHTASRQIAERLFERIVLSARFVDYLSKARPYFALDVLLVAKPFFQESFLKLYVDALLNNEDSVLYEEIKQVQNTGTNGRYVINSLNPLIDFFFGQTWRAERMKLYKPIGDAVSDHLKRLGRNREIDPYRRPLGDFFESGRWRSPVFAGRCLFEYMITEGLHRGTHWHMWLMYLEYWAQRIVENMADPGPDIDQSREWPTPYHYLLYELFSTQQDWIATAAELDQNLESVVVKKVDLEYGSIAKSATLSLGACLRIVVESEHIAPTFKGYLLGVVAHGFARVVEQERDKLAGMYERAVVNGGTQHRDLSRFRSGLLQAIAHVDDDSRYMSPAADLIKALSQSLDTEGRPGQ